MCWHCMIWVRQQHIYSFDSAAVERLFIRYDHLCMTELHVVFFLLGDSPVSEFYVPTFRNTLSVPFWILCAGVSELSFCSIWILCADVLEHSVCSIWTVCADVSEHTVPSEFYVPTFLNTLFCLNFMCRRFGTLFLFHFNFMCWCFGTLCPIWILCADVSEHCLSHLHRQCK